MLFEIFLISNLEIWNTIIFLSYFFLMFYALGRVIQKRINFNYSSIIIAIPLGFVFYLFLTFCFIIPIQFLNLGNNFILYTYLIENVIIWFILFVYYESWWFISVKKNNWRFNVKDYIWTFLFIFFLAYAISFNSLYVGFNEFVPNDNSSTSSLSTTLIVNNLTLNRYVDKLFFTEEFYYQWVIFLLLLIVIYNISLYWSKQFSKNSIVTNVFGFFIAITMVNYFWIFDTSSVTLYEFILFFLSVSILKYYYHTWNKDVNTLIMSYFIIFTILSFSNLGILIFLFYFISTLILQIQINKQLQKAFISGTYILFFELIFLTYLKSYVLAIVISFIILIFLIPYTIKYNSDFEHNENEIILERKNLEFFTSENEAMSNKQTKGLSWVFFFMILEVLSFFIILSIVNSDISNYFEHYYKYPINFNLRDRIIINLCLITIPLLLIFFFGFIKPEKSKWFSFISIMYMIFLNPISFSLWWYLFENPNFYFLVLLWPLILIEVIWSTTATQINKYITIIEIRKEKRRHARRFI